MYEAQKGDEVLDELNELIDSVDCRRSALSKECLMMAKTRRKRSEGNRSSCLAFAKQ
jgi:hypothetical protein